MKRVSTLIVALSVVLSAISALAVNVDYYWSGDGVSQGGNGTWDITNPHWNTGTSGPFPIVWTNEVHGQDYARFGGPAGTVTIDPSVTNVRRFRLDSPDYVIGAATLKSDQPQNGFVIQMYNAGTATVYTSFLLTNVNANINIRVRTENAAAAVLNLHGDYQFEGGSGTKWFDLESSQASAFHTINFYGRLLATPGNTDTRLRFGYNNNSTRAHNAVYNLLGANTFVGRVEFSAGTVVLHNDAALGDSGNFIQVGDSGTGNNNIRLYTVGNRTIPQKIQLMNGTAARIVGCLDASTVVFNGNVDLLTSSGVNQLYAAAGGTVTFNGWVNDGGNNRSIEKTGPGTVILTQPNNYGNTVVKGGTLLVNNAAGSGTGQGTVTVESGAKLGGTGRIAGTVNVQTNAILAPGTSVGTLHINTLNLDGGSVVEWEKAPGVDVTDVIVVTNLTIGATTTIKVKPLPGATPDGLGVTNTIFKVVTSMSGVENLQLDLSETAGWFGGLTLMEDGVSVGVWMTPEPGIVGLGLIAGLVALRKRA